MTLYKNDDGETIHLETGETLSIILLGTGPSKADYEWKLNYDEFDPNVMERKTLHYFANEEEQWTFEAKGLGVTTIKLEYKTLIVNSEIKDTFVIKFFCLYPLNMCFIYGQVQYFDKLYTFIDWWLI